MCSFLSLLQMQTLAANAIFEVAAISCFVKLWMDFWFKIAQVVISSSKPPSSIFGISYIIKFNLSVCICVCMFVGNRLPNHAYYGDEAFTGYSVGLG